MNISKRKAIFGVGFLAILIAACALSCGKSDEEKAELFGLLEKKGIKDVSPATGSHAAFCLRITTSNRHMFSIWMPQGSSNCNGNTFDSMRALKGGQSWQSSHLPVSAPL